MGLQVLCVSILTFLLGLAALLASTGFTAQATTTQVYVLEAPDSGRAW